MLKVLSLILEEKINPGETPRTLAVPISPRLGPRSRPPHRFNTIAIRAYRHSGST